MNSSPMHSVTVEHDWQEVDRVDFRTTSEVAIMHCADCHAEKQVLHVKSSEKTHRNQESEEEVKQALFTTTMNLYIGEMLDGTKYATSEALMDGVANRYNGQIAGEDIPFGWLKPWMAKHSRNRQRKVLLRYKQGPVCNRCDLIFTDDELEVDHIEHQKHRGQLTDLQLLCKNCNREKGDARPDKRDVSPFKFKGESCLHRVKCTEVAPMLPFYDSETRDAICFCSPAK